ncbi:hypothetical protein [Allorhizobium ampelinum]|uniref:hypothetical protein n=1 Tax=Allorhizobium ampelinum TaxID=3025782 RepID=UPI0011789D85|nr:hypothetical protein [Allorhizobium ampelinum]NTA27429.1 hypothetical protein [Allorhizobium ampelinum]
MGEAAPIERVIESIKSQQRRIIVEMLSKRLLMGVHIDTLIDEIYKDDPNGGAISAIGCVHVQISHARKDLKPFGWTILNKGKSHSRLGMYYLVPLEAGA